MLTGFYSGNDYPKKLQRVKYYDIETDNTLIFLINNFSLPTTTNAKLYKSRCRAELFFKWIKQNLRIEIFYETSGNAAKSHFLSICLLPS
jgi:IS4 transposase